MNRFIYKISLLIVLVCNFPLAHAANVFKGQELYSQYCQSCHGNDGRGTVPGAGDFTRSEGLLRNDIQIYEAIRTGKNGMPSYLGILKDQEILDIISHLRTYQR